MLEANCSDEPNQTPSALFPNAHFFSPMGSHTSINVWLTANASSSFFRCCTNKYISPKTRRASSNIHFVVSVHSSAAVESQSRLCVKGLQYECMHAQVRHVQINMYDSTAVGFLLCMLMISFKFNNATVVH